MKYVLIITFAVLMLAATASAQEDTGRYGFFEKAIISAGKIRAMDEVCPPESGRSKQSLSEQIMEGFALEDGTETQKQQLITASDTAYSKHLEELGSKEEIECGSSDFIWEKQYLYENLLSELKNISRSRLEEKQK